MTPESGFHKDTQPNIHTAAVSLEYREELLESVEQANTTVLLKYCRGGKKMKSTDQRLRLTTISTLRVVKNQHVMEKNRKKRKKRKEGSISVTQTDDGSSELRLKL